MSIWAVNWALLTPVTNPTHKLVLVALANFADDDDLAWPRVDTLSQLTSSSRRTVFRALDALVGAGLIERLAGFERADRGGLHRAQSVWRYGCPIVSRGVRVTVIVVLEWFVNPLVKSTVTLVTHSSTPPYLVEVCSLVVL